MKKLINNKNYLLYWFGTALIMASSNIVQFMLSLYVLDITGSGTLFATMLSITIFPRLLFTPLAGVLGDRFNRKKWMVIMGFCSGMTLALSGTLHLSVSTLTIWMIYVLVILLEVFETFFSSASAGILPLIVSKEELGDATSMAGFDDGIVGIIGPIIAAILYGRVEIGFGLIIAGLISIIGISLIMVMRILHNQENSSIQEKKTLLHDFFEGIKLINSQIFLRKLVILAPMINFFLTSVFTISIVFVLRENLGVSAVVYGNYQALLSAVSLLAPLIAMNLMKKRDAIRLLPSLILVMTVGFVLMTLGMILGYFEIVDERAMIAILFLGSAVTIAIVVIMNITTLVLFQTIIPSNFLSRIASVVNLLATISIPIGQMIYGSMIDLFPAFWTLILSTVGIFILYPITKSILKNVPQSKDFKVQRMGGNLNE